MLGARKTALQVANTAIKNQIEKIKKVDIDIIDSGAIEKNNYIYEIQQDFQTTTPISILTYDRYNPVIRFKIDLKKINSSNLNCTISSMYLDENYQLKPQLIIEDALKKEEHFEVNAYLNEPEGSHQILLNLVVKKDNIQSTRDYIFKFKVVKVLTNTETQIDIPQDSYRDALLNVTKLWLMSSKYDRVRKPDWAGFFDDRLRKYPMTSAGAEQVQTDLAKAIKNKIGSVYISDIKATPLLTERGWDVQVESIDTNTQISTGNTSEDTHIIVSIDNDNVSNVKKIE